jgi:ribose 5-phosphate isomerase B
MERCTIGFASDHAGFALKEQLAQYLLGKGYSVKDFGAYSPERSDYPDFAHPLAAAIVSGECRFGVTICWTGNGINMTMNRHRNVRSAICLCEEMAQLARNHNDANSCSIAAKYVEPEQAKRILDVFLNENFEGGRHLTRVQKIELPEQA